MTQKTHIAVIYGGNSGEHEISLRSAASVVKFLDKQQYDITPIAIDKQGVWYINQLDEVYNKNDTALKLTGDNSQAVAVPYINHGSTVFSQFDVFFPVLHGPLYEDGAIQGILQSANVPFVGSSILGSAITMDKDVAKRLLATVDIPIVPWLTVRQSQWQRDKHNWLDSINNELGMPVFVKPASLGSSVGTTKVNEQSQLQTAIDAAFVCDKKVMVEKGINAREIELSVLHNKDNPSEPLVSLPGEIIVSDKYDFYDYQSKYLDDNGAELQLPANIAESQINLLQAYAKRAFVALECDSMARVDFLVDRDNNDIYLNELNTIPGFTNISMYPKCWEISNLPYSDLLTKLIELAQHRYQEDQAIIRDWTML